METPIRKIQKLASRAERLTHTTIDVEPKDYMRLVRILRRDPWRQDIDHHINQRAMKDVSLYVAGLVAETGGTAIVSQEMIDNIKSAQRERVEKLTPDDLLNELQADARAEINERGLDISSFLSSPTGNRSR